MSDDFAATADRMMLDARTLYAAGAHRNACYLAGYVVECTLKSLLKQAGADPWGHDLGSLHDEVATLLMNSNAVVAKYQDPSHLAPTMLQEVAPPKLKNGQLIYSCHWDPKHRYDGALWSSAVSADYLREADKCHDVLLAMFLDGLVVLP
jgi:HEPN domain-containing protein